MIETKYSVVNDENLHRLIHYRIKMFLRGQKANIVQKRDEIFEHVLSECWKIEHKYDPSKGPINTFFYRRVHGAIIDWLRMNVQHRDRKKQPVGINTGSNVKIFFGFPQHDDNGEHNDTMLTQDNMVYAKIVENKDYDPTDDFLSSLTTNLKRLAIDRLQGLTPAMTQSKTGWSKDHYYMYLDRLKTQLTKYLSNKN